MAEVRTSIGTSVLVDHPPVFELEKMNPTPFLGDSFGHTRIPVPEGIVGSSILGFGAVPRIEEFCPRCRTMHTYSIEGGGLVIDYLPEGHTDPVRLVLAFNDLGMWIEGTGKILRGNDQTTSPVQQDGGVAKEG
jgi:hypothetical protein